MSAIAEFLTQARGLGAFSGAAYAVGTSTGILEQGAVGTLAWGGEPATLDSLWDLASVTKPVVALGLMALVERGAMALEDPISLYLREYEDTDRAGVTLFQLLTHTAGLPAEGPLHRTVRTRRDLLAAVRDTPLAYEPGSDVIYTSYGFMMIGQAMEAASGDRLDGPLAQLIFRPLGMTQTLYNPSPGLKTQTAATEDSSWRGYLIRGEVHDGNAFLMGGIAGHAGLFSTCNDMTRLCQGILRVMNGGEVGAVDGASFLSAATLRYMARNHTPHLRLARGLGWQGRDVANSPAGDLFSEHSFGHTGFTGTSVWIDPDNDLFAVLLTNRIHPKRDNERIASVRVTFHDLAVSAVLAGRRTH